jgi:uncharacterized membrane protein YbjE (DUF340 family)
VNKEELIDCATDIFARVAGCFIIGAIIGLIFGSANHPIESLGTPIFVMLLIEFLG